VTLSLSTIVAGTETAPAVYVGVPLGSRTLDIWRATTTGDLTLRWDDADPSVALRYIPKQLTVAELSGGRAISVKRYKSRDAAWSAIHALYDVSRRDVHAALLVASPSTAAPTAGVTVRIPPSGG
jgi:hypothetical protein